MGTLIPVCSIATGQQKAPAVGRGFFCSYEYSTGAPLPQQHELDAPGGRWCDQLGDIDTGGHISSSFIFCIPYYLMMSWLHLLTPPLGLFLILFGLCLSQLANSL